uniref:Uncharacterized protein n=1 Tax=Fagus sylvatica TaxID=28930 RepID=A0A2N9IGH4_FAGSY
MVWRSAFVRRAYEEFGYRIGEISPDLVRSHRFWPNLHHLLHGATSSSNRPYFGLLPHQNRSTDPPDPTTLTDGQRVQPLQTRLCRVG